MNPMMVMRVNKSLYKLDKLMIGSLVVLNSTIYLGRPLHNTHIYSSICQLNKINDAFNLFCF